MFHIVLFEPEIPPNTGNVIRLCANTGNQLHLIHPLGFELDEKKVRRAGLDYHDMAIVNEHANFDTFLEKIAPNRLFAYSTRGKSCYTDPQYEDGDAFVFGPETRGLPSTMLDSLAPENILRLPMKQNCRSLNLSNTVAIAVYEAWRQQGFDTH